MIAFISTRFRQLPIAGSRKTRSRPKKSSHFYLGAVTVLAVTGHAYVMLFPALFLTGILSIYASITAAEPIDIMAVIAWAVIAIIAGLVSFRALQFKPTRPVGLALTNDKVPELFTLVHEIRSQHKRPAIHRIVVTGNYDIDIVRTPKWALPFQLSNTLLIGLPVMQSLSPRQFECLLAGRIGQFSMRDNLLTNWLYQQRAIWSQYRAAYRTQKGFGVEPLKLFFAVYTPFYKSVSTRAARQDKLKADSYAMQLYNDEEVREMITADSLCRWFLNKQYWPAVYKMAAADTKTPPAPHTKMAPTVYTNINGGKLQSFMAKVAEYTPPSNSTEPCLQSRIENIGHEKARMASPATKTAAAEYLGGSLKNVIALVDKLWQKNYLEKRKRQRTTTAKSAT